LIIGYKYFLFFILTPFLFSHEPIKSKPNWKNYYRLGAVNNNSSFGFSSYNRLKRTTNDTYNDFRFFGNFFKKNTILILRQKSSRMIFSFKNFYSFNTVKLEKNTFNDVNIRYQSNQGLGYLIKDYKRINLNIELGITFDNSDYLNSQQKRSYLKTGNTIDLNLKKMKFKFEIDYFKQINKDTSNYDFSRIDLLLEASIPIKKNINLIFGILNQTNSQNIYSFENNLFFINLSNSKNLNWKL